MPGEVGSKRTPWHREKDKRTVIKLLRRGYSNTQIADYLDISPQQVDYDIKSMLSEAQMAILEDRRKKDAKQHLEELVDVVREVQAESWEQWDASKGKMTRELRDQLLEALAKAKGGQIPENITLRLKSLPDAIYLRTILNCVGTEAKLLGLVGPSTKIDVTAVAGVTGLNWDQLVEKPRLTPAQAIEARIHQELFPDGGPAKPNGAT